MFDIGSSEFLLIAVVAIVAIGPKDMPLALRTAGRWIGKFRRMSNHFRSGIEAMIREAELEEMEQKWREQNNAVMRAFPAQGPAPALEQGPVLATALPGGVTIDGPPVPGTAVAGTHAEAPFVIPPQPPLPPG